MAIFNLAADGEDFPPELRELFASHPQPRLGRDFNIRFWANFEPRRARYRGFPGVFRRIIELEIEGIVVWRAFASTVSGGAFCALVLGIGLVFASPDAFSKIPLKFPFPDQSYAYYAREFDSSRRNRELRV